MLKLPAFFFPTSVVIIDDDQHFARLLKATLGDSFITKTFSNTNEIAALVKKEVVCLDVINTDLLPLSDSRKVQSFIADKNAANLVSVWLTDYQLAHTNGIDLLKKLSPPLVQRVLISNFIYPDVVNNAYKDQVINAYISKLDGGLLSSLKHTIEEMQDRFFINYCEKFYSPNLRKSKLCDAVFATFVKKIIKKFDITHMVSSNDLTLFSMTSTTKGHKINLHVAEDQDFDDILNSIHGEKAQASVLSRIKQRLAIPCYENGRIPDGATWGEYLKPVTRIQGEKEYFISYYMLNEDILSHG